MTVTKKSAPKKETRKTISNPFVSDYGTFFDEVSASLSNDRRITLNGEVSEGMFSHLHHSINYLATVSKKPIEISLNTPGGSVTAGLAIYDTIQEVKSRGIAVNITIFGQCASMGVPILQSATERRSGENASFLLHTVSYQMRGSSHEHKDHIEAVNKLNKRLNGIIGRRSKLTEEELLVLTDRKDYTIDAQEALAHGLIDTII